MPSAGVSLLDSLQWPLWGSLAAQMEISFTLFQCMYLQTYILYI